MEYAILGIVLIMGIAAVVLTRSKGGSDSKTEEVISKKKVPETIEEKFTNPIEANRRKHSTMDAPMIRSRFEKMKIHDGLEAHAKKKLERLVVDICKEEREMLWWEPLRDFSKLPNASKGARFMFLNAESTMGQQTIQFILNLSEMIRFCGLRFKGIETEKGEKLWEDRMEDGAYIVHSIFGADEFTIPFRVRDDAIDVRYFVGQVNTILKKKKSSQRLVVLAPDDCIWCLLISDYSEAKRAETARWAEILA
ncbi:MAG: hypothetical protein VX278_10975 [Myxococcota bacterium]|nr:hypothetical protein [Myxococcota bacterium]